ncbi:sensor histidine kinase [Dactylosporangium sp. CA-139066]|uniref:sensor histidine kinase n=1 Tax=Dactylosporangium sp. CA-139066 TaxID=3239930 RepID=UPI003D9438AE
MSANLVPLLLRPKPPPLWLGLVVAVALIALETVVLFPLRGDSYSAASGVVYLVGVLAISMVWRPWLSVSTAVASALAFNYFHVPPFWAFEFTARRDLPIVVVFIAAGLATGRLADLARSRAAEAPDRRQEASLATELAKCMVGADDLRSALGPASQRLAQVLELRSAAIRLDVIAGDGQRAAFPLCDGARRLGTLLVPADLPDQTLERLRQRVVPTLEPLLCAACEHEAIVNSLKAGRNESTLLTEDQAAWRRVPTMVARGASLVDVFDAMTDELCRTLGRVRTALMRYEPDCTATRVAGLDELHGPTSIPLEGDTVVGTVLRTRRPARIDSYDSAAGPAAATARGLGIRSAVGVPVMVQGCLWGVLAVVSFTDEAIPPGTEARLADFSDLIATAVANVESRAQLAASRARIVTAADNARRQFERELHDGVLQRVVSLGLELSMTEASMPPELDRYKEQLSHVAQGLNGVFTSLQEVTQGIHPAITSKGGLGASIRSLARRSAIPVELNLNISRPLPEHAEVAAYHIVSEALANAATHARATIVHVNAEAENAVFRLSIQDDGIGGASLGKGTGLIGLQDRIEALGGHMEVVSPARHGTALLVKIPIDEA